MEKSRLTNFPPNIHPSPSPTKLTAEFSSVTKDVSIDHVARYFGGNGYKPDEKTSERIRQCIDVAAECVTPKATYTIFPVAGIIAGKEIILENGLKLSLPECFTDSGTTLMATVIGTLGEGLEEKCRDLASSGKIYESTLFDAVGTAMLDLMSDEICKRIENIGKQSGLLRGERLGPGIDGYPLEQQHQLFKLAGNESINVSLNSSAIMIPTKSISFFMMLTTTAHKSETKHKCSVCRLPNCQFRMLPMKENRWHKLL